MTAEDVCVQVIGIPWERHFIFQTNPLVQDCLDLQDNGNGM